MEKLEALIAPEALYDSAERCDAPKCHPETRVALQDDLYSWIEQGDADDPRKMSWVTGPAGTGKTAVMGSLTELCKKKGLPVASFFFSSTGSIGRRTKTAFVTTIAHQLAQHRQDVKEAIAAAINADSIVFKKNLRVQMEAIVLEPLRAVSGSTNSGLRGVIIVDGLDECQVERDYDKSLPGAKIKHTPARKNDEDQLEILQVLHQALSEPAFPFRILVASRPERVFREFFDPPNSPAPLYRKVDLHEDYNADADIALFLDAHFNLIRRRYNLPVSWPPHGAVQTLVNNASSQFIYAATVVRFLDMGHRETPDALLEAILKMKAPKTITSNPFEQLDVLYTHILESSPDPPLSTRWIRAIDTIHKAPLISDAMPVAAHINLFLQTDSQSSEAEHLLGNLHSLVWVPSPSEQATQHYRFYHKSLLDFLNSRDRCRRLHQDQNIPAFLWDRFNQACIKLKAQIAAGAIHDSKERCDAPKCHLDTRVAVQDDLYSWIVDEDVGGESGPPKKIKWVTGPAGTGKTAVMGSLSERCKAGGVLAATFFFASWSTSVGRRRKAFVVTTIAHQLARYHPDLRVKIAKAIEMDSDIFDKGLQTQMEALILGPLQEITRRPSRSPPNLRGAIIIDGLDECEADPSTARRPHGQRRSRPRPAPRYRRDDEDQREILEVLRAASLHPSFPFRIIIASRPEPVFREFFDHEDNAASFSPKLNLHEEYNADADIALFLTAQFNLLRRRYNLPRSWPPRGTISALVGNASGQFIYAATVIRFLDTRHQEPPKVLLDAILQTGAARKMSSNPLEQLDALYVHILNSSPNPPLSIRWIHGIDHLNAMSYEGVDFGAFNMELLFQEDPESNEAEHLLGNLHSLIRIPPHNHRDSTAKYDFYHKSLIDFLADPKRSGELYISTREAYRFIWDRIHQACASEYVSATLAQLDLTCVSTRRGLQRAVFIPRKVPRVPGLCCRLHGYRQRLLGDPSYTG
ncbi:hypothetical protein MD484_g2863, partial [Candolleomyces efflorescens]